MCVLLQVVKCVDAWHASCRSVGAAVVNCICKVAPRLHAHTHLNTNTAFTHVITRCYECFLSLWPDVTMTKPGVERAVISTQCACVCFDSVCVDTVE